MHPLRKTLRAAAVLLLAAGPMAGQSASLELTCRPEHALLDLRRERPADVRDHSPHSTYYLFDNPQLFELRVSLMNLSPDRRPVARDWSQALKVRIRRDGVELAPEDYRVEPARLLRRALIFLKDAKPVGEPRFRRRLTAPGADPLMPYDDIRHDERAVKALPSELATYEEAVIVLRFRSPDGGPLPLGLYGLSVFDEANHERCYSEQLIVMRAPLSPLDTVDAHLVRAQAHQAAGELEEAAREAALATEEAPGVLKGWVYRSAIAVARNDLAGQAAVADRLEKLLAEKAGSGAEEFEGIVQDAKVVARNAPELRRRLAAKEATDH